ncbi:hypothetical protein RhiJN_05204 [Ceratobasidium sp. AG-Ba]|nr:hypothetical protein RhiJN_05204 [Ceratobasidium sp. AG-Ba]
MLYAKIAHFLFLAAYLEDALLTLIGYRDPGALSAIAPLYLVGTTATKTLPRVYKLVNNGVADFKVQSSLAPWLRGEWHTQGLEGNPFQFLINPFPFLGTGARTDLSPYATAWLDGVTPTSSWSAKAPVHAYNAGLSAGTPTTALLPQATPSRPPSSALPEELDPVVDASPAPSVPAASTPDAWALTDPSPTHSTSVIPAHTVGVSMSVSESVAPLSPLSSAEPDCPVVAPAPTVAATVQPPAEQATYGPLESTERVDSDGRAWFDIVRAFKHGWALCLVVLSIAVQVSVTVCLHRYYTQRCHQGPESSSAEEIVEPRLQLEGLGAIQHMLDDFNLSPEELRSHIETASSARKAKAPVKVSKDLVRRAKRLAQLPPLDEAEADWSLEVPPSVPSAAQSSPRGRVSIPFPAPVSNVSVSVIDSAKLAARILKISEDIRHGEERMDRAIDELVQVAAELPQRTPARTTPAGPLASREIRRNARRGDAIADELNVSPLAHKKRTRVPEVESSSIIPPPRRSRKAIEWPGPAVQPAMPHVQEPGSMVFDPIATSSMVHGRLAPLPVWDPPSRSFEATVSSRALSDISTIFAVSERMPSGAPVSSTFVPPASRPRPASDTKSALWQSSGEASPESPYARPPARLSHRRFEAESPSVVHQSRSLGRLQREWEAQAMD